MFDISYTRGAQAWYTSGTVVRRRCSRAGARGEAHKKNGLPSTIVIIVPISVEYVTFSIAIMLWFTTKDPSYENRESGKLTSRKTNPQTQTWI